MKGGKEHVKEATEGGLAFLSTRGQGECIRGFLCTGEMEEDNTRRKRGGEGREARGKTWGVLGTKKGINRGERRPLKRVQGGVRGCGQIGSNHHPRGGEIRRQVEIL